MGRNVFCSSKSHLEKALQYTSIAGDDKRRTGDVDIITH
jgi:hypothetical protein